jgi:uncharacterized protein (TIGR02453 family)
MKQVLTFLKSLEVNNHKAWFDEHRKEYEAARAQLVTFTDDLIEGLSKIDVTIQDLKSKDCLFRINRDVRFSKDKSPYKNNMGAMFAPGGKKSQKACYYIHLQPGHSFLAGGIYMPEKEVLEKVRQEIDYNGEALLKVLHNASFKKYFDHLDQEMVLTRMPKGYEETNEMASYLKFKSFTVTHSFSDKEVASPDFINQVLAGFKKMKPFNDFLNQIFE